MTVVKENISFLEKLTGTFSNGKMEKDAFRELRLNALNAFETLGIPDRKNEEYKYSVPDFLTRYDFSGNPGKPSIQEGDINRLTIDKEAYRVVLINGVFSAEYSILPTEENPSFSVSSLTDNEKVNSGEVQTYFGNIAKVEDDAFIALNTASWKNAWLISTPDNTKVDRPIEVMQLFTSDFDAMISPRVLLLVGNNSVVEIFEASHLLPKKGKIFNNSVTEIAVGENSSLKYYKLQTPGSNLFSVNTTCALQKKASHFDTNTVSIGGDWLRNNLSISLAAENCETHLNGLSIASGNDHIDNHTLVDHGKPHCESNQIYKGILSGKSTGVFNGKIFVQKDAQKTNAYQSSKNILLSEDATINTKPQLEIYADDVKCSHGTTTGQLDEESMFYLRSRGLGFNTARNLLIHAFASDVLETIGIESVRKHIEAMVHDHINV